jgi:hypothetical protein
MAATTQSVQYAEQVAAEASFYDRINDSRQIDGPVEYAFIDVATTVDNAATNVIYLVDLPEDVIVIPELSFIQVTDDMTSGAVTFDIGDSVDVDRYCDGANVASTGTVQFISAAIPDGYTNRHRTTDTTRTILLTIATMTATIEAGAFRVVLAYKSL